MKRLFHVVLALDLSQFNFSFDQFVFARIRPYSPVFARISFDQFEFARIRLYSPVFARICTSVFASARSAIKTNLKLN